jgi:hypothetical protein
MDRSIPHAVIREIAALTQAAFLLGEDGLVALGHEVLLTTLAEQQRQLNEVWAPQVVQHLHETLARYDAEFAHRNLPS